MRGGPPRDAVLAALVLGDPADEQVSAGAAVAAVSDEPTEGLDHRTARALLENTRSALPGTTIIAAIHDRTLDHLPVPADATVRLAAGRILRVT